MSWQSLVERAVGPALIDKVPRDHHESDTAFRHRRVVVVVVLILGSTMLGFSLAVRPGDSLFYVLTIAVALTWIAGGLLSGPLHLGFIGFRQMLRRPIVTPVVLGLAVSAVFLAGAVVVRQIPPLRDYVLTVLQHASAGNTYLIVFVTLLNGAAEEVFFRGALFAALGQLHPVVLSTLVYALATVATGNPMLVFAAATLGILLALQRRASGGILASILTHLTWSSVMLFALPPILQH